ncbi:MAG: apolipoprotein N-acyltransferase [Pseudomonadota bacterium]
MSLAFAPWNLGFVAWLAFVPLLVAIERERKLSRAAACGFFFGLFFFMVDLRWIIQTMVIHGKFASFDATLIFISMVFALAFIPGLFSLICAFLMHRGIDGLVAAPLAWTTLEFVRTYIFTGFPWDCVGYSQARWLTLVQISDLTGVYGVSFLVIVMNASALALMRIFKDKSWVSLARFSIGIAILIVVLTYGTIRMNQFPINSVGSATVAGGILQGNIPQDIKWDPASRAQSFATYDSLAADALKKGATFLIWPETSIPVVIGGTDITWKLATNISRRLEVPMLIGAPFENRVGDQIQFFNSAFLVENGELTQRYDKIHLVPFGEYMPLSWILPLGPGIAAREEDYSAGRVMTVMNVNGFPPFSVLICYEAIFPNLSRTAVNSGAKVLVNITNDGWFGDSAAPYQHLAMAGFRAIENRVWLFRAANTGVSAVFDPGGRLLAWLSLMERGQLVQSVPSSPKAGSFYTRNGDVFAWTISCLLILFTLTSCIGSRVFSERNG